MNQTLADYLVSAGEKVVLNSMEADPVREYIADKMQWRVYIPQPGLYLHMSSAGHWFVSTEAER